MLVSGDDYNADLFLDHISQVIQSNDTGLTDDVLELVVTGVHNKRGGGRLKLKTIPYDEIINKKKLNLYTPSNTHDNLCFSLCMIHFLQEGVTGGSTVPDETNLEAARTLHRELGTVQITLWVSRMFSNLRDI